jgi:hypothetical protein
MMRYLENSILAPLGFSVTHNYLIVKGNDQHITFNYKTFFISNFNFYYVYYCTFTLV